MVTFTEAELKLIRKLTTQPAQTVLQIKKPCPTHSYCNPLPLFQIYRVDEASFEAQWNEYHSPGPRQIFEFSKSS
jgi:hypothetical protein